MRKGTSMVKLPKCRSFRSTLKQLNCFKSYAATVWLILQGNLIPLLNGTLNSQLSFLCFLVYSSHNTHWRNLILTIITSRNSLENSLFSSRPVVLFSSHMFVYLIRSCSQVSQTKGVGSVKTLVKRILSSSNSLWFQTPTNGFICGSMWNFLLTFQRIQFACCRSTVCCLFFFCFNLNCFIKKKKEIFLPTDTDVKALWLIFSTRYIYPISLHQEKAFKVWIR